MEIVGNSLSCIGIGYPEESRTPAAFPEAYLSVPESLGGGGRHFRSGPPPHIHRREDETFWVLEGELEFMVGDGTVRAPAGSFVYAPRDIPHTYKNVGTTPARYLVMIQPAGLEEFFMEVSDPAEDPTAAPPAHGQEVINRIMADAPQYGLEMLPPPPEQ